MRCWRNWRIAWMAISVSGKRYRPAGSSVVRILPRLICVYTHFAGTPSRFASSVTESLPSIFGHRVLCLAILMPLRSRMPWTVLGNTLSTLLGERWPSLVKIRAILSSRIPCVAISHIRFSISSWRGRATSVLTGIRTVSSLVAPPRQTMRTSVRSRALRRMTTLSIRQRNSDLRCSRLVAGSAQIVGSCALKATTFARRRGSTPIWSCCAPTAHRCNVSSACFNSSSADSQRRSSSPATSLLSGST